MKISIFGLGYVGCVTGACLSELGHTVIGVDTNQVKVDMINKAKSPIIEERIQPLIENTVNNKLFRATTNWMEAVQETEIALVSVGTPSRNNGSIDLTFVERVTQQIAKALKTLDKYFVVVYRSTLLPGTVEGTLIPILKKHSARVPGDDFGICMVPEFLREGSSVHDFFNPPRTLVGEYDKRSGDPVVELFEEIDAPLIRTQIKTAEMVKYADNSFHALKVTFANEIGNICKSLDIDSHELMEIFCKDTKLNISPSYLKPGFAFGGSCLPKDIRAITYYSKINDIETPLLNAILKSNQKHISAVIDHLIQKKGKTLGFLGLSFKGGTDDLRESPLVHVVETMIGKGFTVRIYDKNVSIAKLFGANKEYIEKEIPHISSLMCSSPKDLIDESDVIVIGHNSEEYRKVLLDHVQNHHLIVDLVKVSTDVCTFDGNYFGLCW